MTFYLPIAEMSVNIFTFIGMGAAVGFLSGLCGVGGGFLMTPLLLFLGVPSAVAVGTGAAPIVASSVAGALAQWRRDNVDVKMGTLLLVGGVIGTSLGVQVVHTLRRYGQFELFVTMCYVTFLGVIGALMLIESINAIRLSAKTSPGASRRVKHHNWLHGLPFKMRFHRSKLYISAIPPIAIGLFVGLLAGIMGVGGGFIMVPAMIYLLRMPTRVVVGTSLFQIVFVTAVAAILHAQQNQNVDVVLALLLIIGAVLGTQLGTAAGERLNGEQLRFVLAALVVLVSLRMAWSLVATPDELFSLAPRGVGF